MLACTDYPRMPAVVEEPHVQAKGKVSTSAVSPNPLVL